MCAILYRDGRQWAVDTISQLCEVVRKNDGNRELIACLERGTREKPPSFVKGVQSVIDEVRQIRERAA